MWPSHGLLYSYRLFQRQMSIRPMVWITPMTHAYIQRGVHSTIPLSQSCTQLLEYGQMVSKYMSRLKTSKESYRLCHFCFAILWPSTQRLTLATPDKQKEASPVAFVSNVKVLTSMGPIKCRGVWVAHPHKAFGSQHCLDGTVTYTLGSSI